MKINQQKKPTKEMSSMLYKHFHVIKQPSNLDHYVKKEQSEQLEALYPRNVGCTKCPSSVSNHCVSTHKWDS